MSWFGFRWHFRREGRITIETFRTKEEAVADARDTLRHRWEEYGELSELNIRTRLGIIRQKESYGKDPGRHKG